jgi:putative acetyltransferase
LAHPFLEGEGTGERERLIREVYIPAAETWVHETQAGQIDGFIALLAHEDGPWEVGGIFVDPANQKTGIGHSLITHAAELKGTLTVIVFELNTGACMAYERMGFVSNGEKLEDSGFIQLGLIRKI